MNLERACVKNYRSCTALHAVTLQAQLSHLLRHLVFFGVIFSRIYIFADLPPKVTIDFSISLQCIKAYSFEV